MVEAQGLEETRTLQVEMAQTMVAGVAGVAVIALELFVPLEKAAQVLLDS